MANYVVTESSGEIERYEARTAYGARMAFQSLAEAFNLYAGSITVDELEGPSRFRTKLTARASGSLGHGIHVEVLLYQQGAERMPRAANEISGVMNEPAVAFAHAEVGRTRVNLGMLRIALVGGSDVVDEVFPGMVLPAFDKQRTVEAVTDARRDRDGLAAEQLRIMRRFPGVPTERLDTLEEEFQRGDGRPEQSGRDTSRYRQRPDTDRKPPPP